MEILETAFKSLLSWVWLYRGIITVWGVRHSKRQVIRLVAKQHQATLRFWFRGKIISCDWIKYGSISQCVLDVVLMTLYCSSKTREPTRLMVLKSQKEGQDIKKTKVKTSPEASESEKRATLGPVLKYSSLWPIHDKRTDPQWSRLYIMMKMKKTAFGNTQLVQHLIT